MIPETDKDKARELKAITTFVNSFGGSFEKLDYFDIDFKVFDKDGKFIAYAEVKGRLRNLEEAYPLPVAVRKLVKLADKKKVPVIIWACEDGIIYGKANLIHGEIKWGGRTPRQWALSDLEFMAYFQKQEELKTIKF